MTATATQPPTTTDDTASKTIRSKGDQICDILHRCHRVHLKEVARTIQRDAGHELGILLEELEKQ